MCSNMTKISEELIRKRAEHNECEIFSLKELSLHQQNIEKIEHLDRWCKDLEILYFHNNLIPKIENLGGLKKLEYLNFTLNNITRIENLEGCESLRKLDMTVNFIGELTSVKNLKENYNLTELYLTGNPCADYEGYREYVIASLPQLMSLDGEKISKRERIQAMQNYVKNRDGVLTQQKDFFQKLQQNNSITHDNFIENREDKRNTDQNQKFWNDISKFTPDSRVEIYKHIENERKKDKENMPKERRTPCKLFTDNGRILNVNEAKLQFSFIDDEVNNCFTLDLAIYKYMDTSLIDLDIQPHYVRVLVRGKVFQMVLPEEVFTGDTPTAKRSETTGHLLINMKKMRPSKKQVVSNLKEPCREMSKYFGKKNNVDVTSDRSAVDEKLYSAGFDKTRDKSYFLENSDFEDNLEVPPLM